MLSAFKKIESIVVKLNRVIIIIAGALLPTLIAIGVFYRYVLKKDFFGVEEVEIYIAICMYFVGAALASYYKRHITADLTQSMITNFKVRKAFAVLSTFIAMTIAVIISYCTVDLVTYAYQMNPRTSVWNIPLVTEYAVVLYGMVVMAIYAIRDFIKAVASKEDSQVQQESMG